MGLAGIPLIVIFLWRQGQIQAKARQWWTALVNHVLLRSQPPSPEPAPASAKTEGLPYAVALALGMVLLCWRGF